MLNILVYMIFISRSPFLPPAMATRCFPVIVGLLLGALGITACGENLRTVVVIDAGHGGLDAGAMWGGVAEKTLTLAIAGNVEKYLKARGISTAMTRRSDVQRSLEARAAVANGFRRSLFVSIHCNADSRHEARGIETFYFGAEGRRLASCIHSRLGTRTATPNRGLKQAGYSVLRKTSCPAALVECGFLSSPAERRLLTTVKYQDRVARAIADGIVSTLNR